MNARMISELKKPVKKSSKKWEIVLDTSDVKTFLDPNEVISFYRHPRLFKKKL